MNALYRELDESQQKMIQSPVIGADDANSLMEALQRNTTKIVGKSNEIRAEYIRHLQEKNKSLDDELALLRERPMLELRGGDAK